MITPSEMRSESTVQRSWRRRVRFFFLRNRPNPEDPWLSTVRWGHLLGVLSLGFGLSAGMASLGALLLLHRRGLDEVRWSDVAFPSRWSKIAIAQGNQQIAAAFRFSREGHLREALSFARSGMAHAPQHRAGRLLLARLSTAARRSEAAQQVLLDGLNYHRTDARYVREVFAFLLQHQADQRVVALARELSARSDLPLDAARVAALAAATASHLRGNYHEAEAFLETTPGLAISRDGRLLQAKVDWDRGRHEAALTGLRTLAHAFPADAEIHEQLVMHLRLADRPAETRRASIAFQLAHPFLPAARLAVLRAYHDTGDFTRLTQEIDALLRDFPTHATMLLAAGDFAAQTGNVALAQQLTAHARARGLPDTPHRFLLAEAYLTAGEFREASAVLEALPLDPEKDAGHESLRTSLQAVAARGLGDVSASHLLLARFLHAPAQRPDNLLAVANRFAALKADEEARRILLQAVRLDSTHQPALTRLIEFDLNLNRIDELPARLIRLVMMRRPSPDVLRVARHKLGSDLFLFCADREPALDAIRVALDRESTNPPTRS